MDKFYDKHPRRAVRTWTKRNDSVPIGFLAISTEYKLPVTLLVFILFLCKKNKLVHPPFVECYAIQAFSIASDFDPKLMPKE